MGKKYLQYEKQRDGSMSLKFDPNRSDYCSALTDLFKHVRENRPLPTIPDKTEVPVCPVLVESSFTLPLVDSSAGKSARIILTPELGGNALVSSDSGQAHFPLLTRDNGGYSDFLVHRDTEGNQHFDRNSNAHHSTKANISLNSGCSLPFHGLSNGTRNIINTQLVERADPSTLFPNKPAAVSGGIICVGTEATAVATVRLKSTDATAGQFQAYAITSDGTNWVKTTGTAGAATAHTITNFTVTLPANTDYIAEVGIEAVVSNTSIEAISAILSVAHNMTPSTDWINQVEPYLVNGKCQYRPVAMMAWLEWADSQLANGVVYGAPVFDSNNPVEHEEYARGALANKFGYYNGQAVDGATWKYRPKDESSFNFRKYEEKTDGLRRDFFDDNCAVIDVDLPDSRTMIMKVVALYEIQCHKKQLNPVMSKYDQFELMGSLNAIRRLPMVQCNAVHLEDARRFLAQKVPFIADVIGGGVSLLGFPEFGVPIAGAGNVIGKFASSKNAKKFAGSKPAAKNVKKKVLPRRR